mmetsp:Transcript_5005/g.8921  ORF Transcript_5005/g.8921 Transcript_5005/m.8921 type:complete len:362 (-) Transcript_5005:573-1658(-)
MAVACNGEVREPPRKLLRFAPVVTVVVYELSWEEREEKKRAFKMIQERREMVRRAKGSQLGGGMGGAGRGTPAENEQSSAQLGGNDEENERLEAMYGRRTPMAVPGTPAVKYFPRQSNAQPNKNQRRSKSNTADPRRFARPQYIGYKLEVEAQERRRERRHGRPDSRDFGSKHRQFYGYSQQHRDIDAYFSSSNNLENEKYNRRTSIFEKSIDFMESFSLFPSTVNATPVAHFSPGYAPGYLDRSKQHVQKKKRKQAAAAAAAAAVKAVQVDTQQSRGKSVSRRGKSNTNAKTKDFENEIDTEKDSKSLFPTSPKQFKSMWELFIGTLLILKLLATLFASTVVEDFSRTGPAIRQSRRLRM